MNDKIKNYFKMRAVRHANNRIFYFDNDGIYRSVADDEYRKTRRVGTEVLTGLYVYDRITVDIPRCDEMGYSNGIIVKKAITKLVEGDSLEKLEKILEETKLEHRELPTGLDRFITRISQPEFIRIPGNDNRNTFDLVKVQVNIVSVNAWPGRNKYLFDHILEIAKRVIEKIDKSREFARYGVPVNVLQTEKITLKKGVGTVEFVFSIKGT